MNPIQPMCQSPEISVTLPLTQALDQVKRVLFQPFDLGKWFVIGFCAWLAQLGESGGGSGGNFNAGNRHGNSNFNNEISQAKEYVVANLHWIIPVVVAAVLLIIGLWLLFSWLNSRGKFMLLHCVALNRAEVVVPWNKFARQANSLFWFRVVLGLLSMALLLPLVALGVFIGLATFGREAVAAGVAGLIGVGLLFIALAIGFLLISKFTIDFVVPVMFRRGCTCREGWGIIWKLMRANGGNMVLYLLFQIVLTMAIGMLVLALMIVTCCVCCLMLLPYIGTVILLPVFVFKRAYSAFYLAQYGREFDVFSPTGSHLPA